MQRDTRLLQLGTRLGETPAPRRAIVERQGRRDSGRGIEVPAVVGTVVRVWRRIGGRGEGIHRKPIAPTHDPELEVGHADVGLRLRQVRPELQRLRDHRLGVERLGDIHEVVRELDLARLVDAECLEQGHARCAEPVALGDKRGVGRSALDLRAKHLVLRGGAGAAAALGRGLEALGRAERALVDLDHALLVEHVEVERGNLEERGLLGVADGELDALAVVARVLDALADDARAVDGLRERKPDALAVGLHVARALDEVGRPAGRGVEPRERLAERLVVGALGLGAAQARGVER